jgi:lipooligosaccharide transport system permease protein
MATMAWRVVEREARVYRRLWRSNFFSSFVSPALYLGAMGLGLGGLVDERSQGVGDLTYLQFIAPGLMAATALQLAAGDSLWPVMGGMKWMRTFHAMVSSPLRPADVFIGLTSWLAVRLSFGSTIFVAVAAALGGVRSPQAVLAIPFAVLTGVAFAAPIMAFTASQEDDSHFGLVMRLVVLPLFLFSGTFFPVTQLPGPLQSAVWISPLWHGVELCRAATTGTWGDNGALTALVHVAVLVGVMVAGGWLGTRTFSRRLAS